MSHRNLRKRLDFIVDIFNSTIYDFCVTPLKCVEKSNFQRRTNRSISYIEAQFLSSINWTHFTNYFFDSITLFVFSVLSSHCACVWDLWNKIRLEACRNNNRTAFITFVANVTIAKQDKCRQFIDTVNR